MEEDNFDVHTTMESRNKQAKMLVSTWLQEKVEEQCQVLLTG